MQIENAAQSVFVTAPAGSDLALEPGRQVVARVVDVRPDGAARINLAGHELTVRSDVPLREGQTLNLQVGNVADGRVQLQIQNQTAPPAGGAAANLPETSAQLSQYAPNAIRELARAGVPVTPQLAQAVSRAVEQLASAPGGPNAETAARSIANLVARDFALSPAVAGRVASALDLAGRLGNELSQLASQSRPIAEALPTTAAGTTALRTALAPALSPAELAVARIAQAAETARASITAASGFGPAASAPSAASPQIVANYVASQVASTTRLDAQAKANVTPPPTPAPPATGTPSTSQLAAQAAAVKGDAVAELLVSARGQAQPAAQAQPAILAPTTATQQAQNQNAAAQASTAKPQATGAAMTGQAPLATPPQMAEVVANISVAIARFASALAPAEGAPGMLAGAQAKALSALEGQAPGGSYTPASMGGGSGGAPAALIAAMREALNGEAGGHQNPGASPQLLTTMARYDVGQIASALRQLPEGLSLALTGQLLGTLGDAATRMSVGHQAELRQLVHQMLDDLGKSMTTSSSTEHAALRSALEHVASNDPRPTVQDQAARILHAMDGQQLLSQPRNGADPGYVYFQLPLPHGRNAEVLVKRDPGQRQVTFDTFNIAFLLDTESLGSLMIHLEAHATAVRATVKTDQPALEGVLRAHAEQLSKAVEAQAGRPVLVNTGVFEDGAAPTSLLEPELGFLPGENVYYA